MDLSHPKDHNVHNGISKPLCLLKYVTIDDAIKEIVQLGRGALLVKKYKKCISLSASAPS